MGNLLVTCDPVGAVEIASRLGVARRTVDAWRQRDLGFPTPRWTVGGRPAWDWPDVQAWSESRSTGRGVEWRPTHPYLNVERCPQTLGDAMRLIGRYTESEGDRSPETMQARADLFDAYETWCHLDRPESASKAHPVR